MSANWPSGTPDELKQIGLDPEKHKCCAPEGEYVDTADGKIKTKGCQFWTLKDRNGRVIRECLFRLKHAGGFRGQGPKNVGVYVKLGDADLAGGRQRPASSVIVHPCFLFENNLRGRYETQRETGELIKVVAQEGQEIEVEKFVSKPNPYAADRPIVEKVRERVKVPHFPRPIEANPDVTYEQQIAADVAALMEQEREEEVNAEVTAIAGKIKEPSGERAGKNK